MASNQELRPGRVRPAKAGRRDLSSFLSPLGLADLAPMRAPASSVFAQLAGVRDGKALPGPAFRQSALSSPQRSVSSTRRPVPQVSSAMGGAHV